MPWTSPDNGLGTTLTIGSDSIPLVDVDAPDDEVGDMKTTNLATVGRTHTYKPGLTEGGMFVFDAFYSAATLNKLVAHKAAAVTYTLTLPDLEIITFSGYVKKTDIKFDSDDKPATIRCTSRVAGAVTYTPPS